MKPLLMLSFLAVLAPSARAAMPCTLSDDDKAQLAQSPSKLNAESLEALPPAQKTAVCKSIRTIHALQNGGKLKSASDAAPNYLGPDYTNIYADALDAYLNDLLASKGLGKLA